MRERAHKQQHAPLIWQATRTSSCTPTSDNDNLGRMIGLIGSTVLFNKMPNPWYQSHRHSSAAHGVFSQNSIKNQNSLKKSFVSKKYENSIVSHGTQLARPSLRARDGQGELLLARASVRSCTQALSLYPGDRSRGVACYGLRRAARFKR
jgi:hypothetical protein